MHEWMKKGTLVYDQYSRSLYWSPDTWQTPIDAYNYRRNEWTYVTPTARADLINAYGRDIIPGYHGEYVLLENEYKAHAAATAIDCEDLTA